MWALASVAAGATSAESVGAAWREVASAVARIGAIPFDLSAEDCDVLAGGESVVRRVDTEAGSFATGAVWVNAPTPDAWIAVQDSADRPLGRELVHEQLPGETPGHRQVYMRMELPWPVADRQWVARFDNNRPLFEATAGQVWQRRFSLAEPSLAPNPSPDAIWVPESEGAWTMITADGGTLCVFTVRTDLGGSIPIAVSRTLAISTVKKALRVLADHAADMATHYRGEHAIVLTPDGAPIPVAP